MTHTILATDLIVFRLRDKLETILIKPRNDKFPGKLAFPGGLINEDENLEEANLRFYKMIVKGEKKPYLEQLYTFGDLDRDPNGRIVSVAYFALVSPETEINSSQDLFPDAHWYDFKKLPEFAYDHKKMASEALTRLRSKLGYTNLISFLMPKEFTLAELQKAYELILDQQFDKRNFRKKINSLKILKELPHQTKGGAHRPARLYAFTDKSPKIIPIF